MTTSAKRPSPKKNFDRVAWSKTPLVLLGSWPAFDIGWQLINYLWFFQPLQLGPNPAEAIEHTTGLWALKFLLLTLAITPLRVLTGWNWLIRYRRMLGLFAFFYGTLHLGAYIVFDQFLRFEAIVNDILKRPFITLGMACFILMMPLAITSTRSWIRRLGGATWNRLHKLVYPCAILAVAHYWLLVKLDTTWPAIYGVILLLLLSFRKVHAWRRTRNRAG